jgi:hypothetical protein
VDGEGTSHQSPDLRSPSPANASRRQLLRNVVSSYAAYIIGLLTTLVLTRVLLRHLGVGT